MIVNGQPTTDDDIDRDMISKLYDTVAELRVELVKSVDRIAKLETALVDQISSEFNTLIVHSTLCDSNFRNNVKV